MGNAMKATLRFTLPEEQAEFNDAVNGGKWKLVLQELDDDLRTSIKYNPKKYDSNHLDVLEKVRALL